MVPSDTSISRQDDTRSLSAIGSSMRPNDGELTPLARQIAVKDVGHRSRDENGERDPAQPLAVARNFLEIEAEHHQRDGGDPRIGQEVRQRKGRAGSAESELACCVTPSMNSKCSPVCPALKRVRRTALHTGDIRCSGDGLRRPVKLASFPPPPCRLRRRRHLRRRHLSIRASTNHIMAEPPTSIVLSDMLDTRLAYLLDPDPRRRAAGRAGQRRRARPVRRLFGSGLLGRGDRRAGRRARRHPRAAAASRRGGTGSGVVISPDGLALTNAHVVNGAREIRLSDTEGRTTEARLLGIDPDTDLALLRADAARSFAVRAARRFQAAQARPSRDRDRQPARLRVDRDRRRDLGARPFAARHHRAA